MGSGTVECPVMVQLIATDRCGYPCTRDGYFRDNSHLCQKCGPVTGKFAAYILPFTIGSIVLFSMIFCTCALSCVRVWQRAGKLRELERSAPGKKRLSSAKSRRISDANEAEVTISWNKIWCGKRCSCSYAPHPIPGLPHLIHHSVSGSSGCTPSSRKFRQKDTSSYPRYHKPISKRYTRC